MSTKSLGTRMLPMASLWKLFPLSNPFVSKKAKFDLFLKESHLFVCLFGGFFYFFEPMLHLSHVKQNKKPTNTSLTWIDIVHTNHRGMVEFNGDSAVKSLCRHQVKNLWPSDPDLLWYEVVNSIKGFAIFQWLDRVGPIVFNWLFSTQICVVIERVVHQFNFWFAQAELM